MIFNDHIFDNHKSPEPLLPKAFLRTNPDKMRNRTIIVASPVNTRSYL